MQNNSSKIAIPLRHVVATCPIWFGGKFDEIERKTGIKANNTGKLMKRKIEQAGCDNFHKMLACMSTIDRPG